MEESILTSVKLYLGLTKDYTPFDQQIMMSINTALNALTQLGIGPRDGFIIHDATAVWSDWYGDDKRMEAAKLAVSIRVRLLFDPPASSTMEETLIAQKDEIEWRLLSTLNHPEV